MMELIFTVTSLVHMACSVYLLAVLLRFLLQAAQADYYNPVSQTVVRLTEPLVQAFRRFIPVYRGIDFPILALALVIEMAAITGFGYFYNSLDPTFFASTDTHITIGSVFLWSFIGVVSTFLTLCLWIVIASIILSFVMLFSGGTMDHPVLRLAWQVSEPLLSPFRRLLPPLGGLDFSPILMFLCIYLIRNLLERMAATTFVHEMIVVGSNSLPTNFRIFIHSLSGLISGGGS